jgi:hypothetical protein
MIPLGYTALLAWVVLGVILFRYYPGHRLVVGMYVVGVLFLPEFGSTDYVEGVPRPLTVAGVQLTKPNAIALGLLAGSLLFDRRRWSAPRPRWFDLPMLAWCVGPAVSSVANSLIHSDPVSAYVPTSGGALGTATTWLVSSDLYDGVVRSLDVVVGWGVPYCLARLYITDSKKLGELVLCVVAGAVVYVPLCLLEMWVSPQLHRWVYGFHQHEFQQSIRFDSYRPMVFLEHGLAVGFWMVVGTLAAVWLWVTGPLRKVPYPGGHVSGLWLVIPLVVTTVACKSTGALALGVLGFAVLALARAVRRPAPVLILLCIAPLYAVARTAGSWDGQVVVDLTHDIVGADRAQSLEFRLQNESLLVEKALERPLVGWGGWGRSRVYDQQGQPITIADGLWIVTLGERGLFGLVTLGFVLLLPVALLIVRHGSRPWTQPGLATAAVAAVILGLYSIDCLFNGMVNPVFILLVGGLIALPLHDPAPVPPDSADPSNTWRVRGNQGPTRVASLRMRYRVVSLSRQSAAHPKEDRSRGESQFRS